VPLEFWLEIEQERAEERLIIGNMVERGGSGWCEAETVIVSEGPQLANLYYYSNG
jgi:hypothetical protein